jgi:hypothetical protein
VFRTLSVALPSDPGAGSFRSLISMNQHKRTFVRRSTASKGRSLHQNARSRKRVSLHMVWSQVQQCDHIFVINFIPLLRSWCGMCALTHSTSAIPVQWHQRYSGFHHARYSLLPCHAGDTFRLFVCRSSDGLEREFKYFKWLEGSVCTMCAPGDQRKSTNDQLEQAELNVLQS